MRTIHIVEDDDAVRASVRSLVSTQAGVTVRDFASGDAFLREMPGLDPGVVLLDYQMPGASGLDVLRAVQPLAPRFIAIILTGQGDVTLAVQAMKAGALDFLEKPYDPLDLLRSVDQAFIQAEEGTAEAARRAVAEARIAALTPREKDVLLGLIEGQPNKVIAHQLALSPRTIEIYRGNLMTKLQVRSLSEALRIAFAAGMLPGTI